MTVDDDERARGAAQIDVSKAWLTFSSLLLAFAFVFGNSLRNLYESVVFLFSIHPYDVGDCLFFNENWHQVRTAL